MCVVTWHDFTWRGRGYLPWPPPPPPDWIVHVSAPFGLRGMWRGLKWLAWQYIYSMWALLCATLWLKLVGEGNGRPPPIDWVVHARYHLPTQYSVTISKLIFQTYFEIIINGNFLRLMFVYTTSDIYLTPSLNFEIYIYQIFVNVTYSWPKRNNVVDVYLTSRSKFWILRMYQISAKISTYHWP